MGGAHKGRSPRDAPGIGAVLTDDVYRPHSYEEMRTLVETGQLSPDVAARLDPKKCYGIW